MKKLLLVPLAGVAALCLASPERGGAEPAASGSPNATASAQISPAPSVSASAAPPPPVTQAVPTTPSDAPKDEWTSAEPVWTRELSLTEGVRARCQAFLVREWIKLRCEDVSESTFGAVWGMAGDLQGVSANVVPVAKTSPGLKPASTNEWDLAKHTKTLGMGGRAEVVLQLRPGAASLVELGRFGWDAGAYGDTFEMPFQGYLVEASWAKGEPRPRVVLGNVVVMQ